MEQSTEFSAALKKRALVDLIKRAQGGSFVYPLVWVIIGITNGLHETHQGVLLINAGIFFLVAIIRASHALLSEQIIDKHYIILTRFVESAVITHGFHFGLLTTYVHYADDLAVLEYPMILSGAGIVGAGAASLAINGNIRKLFPTLMIAPFFLYLISHFTIQHTLTAGVAAIFLIYIMVATRCVYDDYWSAITNSALLAQRALELEELSTTDSLTQLRNRMYFDKYYEVEWKRACRYRKPVSIMIIDLDHFKSVNDTFGHAVGDICLQEAAKVLHKRILRAGDIIARYGGEEFIVFLADTAAPGAAVVAHELIEDFRKIEIEGDGQFIKVRCSIGIASDIPDLSMQKSDFLIHADTALYKAKENGRDRCEIFSEYATSDGFTRSALCKH